MNIKLPKGTFLCICILNIVVLLGSSAYAQGDLMIMPKRLVFEGNQRSQEINLANTGADSAIYAISFVQYKMTESGTFEEITEPEEGHRFADEYLRYYPRRVVLGPNEAQTVRVQVTRTGDLEPGEYRSHIYFRAVEEQTALGEEDASSGEEAISIRINAVFGISIPVIIRKGETTASIDLTDMELKDGETAPVLTMAIRRSGNMSTYGDLKVEHISPSGVTTEVGKVKGIAVYTPNTKRYFTVNLTVPDEVDLQQGRLKVAYSTETGKIYGEGEYNLN